jgi:hypothetical protein
MKSKIEVAGGVGQGVFHHYHVLLSEFAIFEEGSLKG